MSTGENEKGLNKIIDLTRAVSIIIFLLHCYFYCYKAFKEWKLTSVFSDRILANLAHTGLFNGFHRSKLISLGLLAISLLGAKSRSNTRLRWQTICLYATLGLLLYFGSYFLLFLNATPALLAELYIGVTFIGYLICLSAGAMISRLITGLTGNKDVFNRENETFPQQERKLENAWSVNLPATYKLKDKTRKSWINILNPFRGLLVMGSPGSGKTWFVVREIIRQQIQKGYSMVVYDFKYDDLSRLTYNHFLQHKTAYPGKPAFYNINFDHPDRSHRCNPLHPSTLTAIADAAEAAKTLLLGLNMDWAHRQGDFFVESPINFLTSLIWFLRKHEDGKYCTWAHVIELAQQPYTSLFSILRTQPEIGALITPFVNAFLHGAAEQLEGQIAGATVSLARLSSPEIYYLITGDDFTLDLNDPDHPKVLCLGNNPQRSQSYGALLSVYLNTITRLCNRKNKHPLALNLDEFSSIMVNSIDRTIATGRSNKMAITLCIQDYSQLQLAYGKEFAQVVLNTCGNIIAGQVTGESAKQLSQRFGRILQDKESFTFTAADTNITRSRQLDLAIPISRVSSLSAGEFIGMVADNPDQIMEEKFFHCKPVMDHRRLVNDERLYKDLPVIRTVTPEMIQDCYIQVKNDIKALADNELQRMMNTPELAPLIISRSTFKKGNV